MCANYEGGSWLITTEPQCTGKRILYEWGGFEFLWHITKLKVWFLTRRTLKNSHYWLFLKWITKPKMTDNFLSSKGNKDDASLTIISWHHCNNWFLLTDSLQPTITKSHSFNKSFLNLQLIAKTYLTPYLQNLNEQFYAETGYTILISVNDDERNTIFTEQYSLIRPIIVSQFL